MEWKWKRKSKMNFHVCLYENLANHHLTFYNSLHIKYKKKKKVWEIFRNTLSQINRHIQLQVYNPSFKFSKSKLLCFIILSIPHLPVYCQNQLKTGISNECTRGTDKMTAQHLLQDCPSFETLSTFGCHLYRQRYAVRWS